MPSMSDGTLIVKERGTIFLGGPPLVKAATGEDVSSEELGGAEVHTRKRVVADHYALNDSHAIEITKDIVSNLNRLSKSKLDISEPRNHCMILRICMRLYLVILNSHTMFEKL